MNLRARTKGEADATTIRAGANTQLTQRLTNALIQYQQVQRWNGKLPTFTDQGVVARVHMTALLSTTGMISPTT